MKVSAITVCFNSAAYIADTLRSVDAQSWSNIEHLIIDGGSRDATLSIVAAHVQPWRRVVSEPDNGIYDAMNKGIRLAQGEVIGFINSDDFYASPDVIQTVARVFADASVDAMYGDLCYVREGEVAKTVRYWRSSEFVPGSFGTGWVPPHPTFFVRRRVLDHFGGFDLRYRIAADFELMARLIGVHRINTVYVPKLLVKMRLGGTTNRRWSNVARQNREIWRALHAHGLQPSMSSFVVRKLFSRGKQFLARQA